MVKKIILFSFVLSFFAAFSALAVFNGPPVVSPGTAGGSVLVPDASGNIVLGTGSTSSIVRFQVIPAAANTFSFKVLDPSGQGTVFSVKPNGVVAIASSTTFSGSTVIQGPVQLSAFGSSNLCLTTNSSGVLATTTCGGGGATSTFASYVTPGAFGTGSYSFPANLSIATTTAPSGGVLFVNGNVGIAKSSPGTALDVAGTVTATAFSGGGAGVTGVTAAAVPWSGVSGKPTTVAGYGITDIYAWAQAPTKPSYAFSELTGTLSDAQVPDNITINTTSTVTAGQFVGGGASLTGVTASSIAWTSITGRPTALSQFTNDGVYLTANQTVTLTGAVTGAGTTAITTAMGTSPSYNVTSGANGYGVCFWNDCTNYKVHFGTGAEYQYGPVTDYSIKFNMNNTAARGWTWGAPGVIPIGSISAGGNMKIAGAFTTAGVLYSSGNGNYAGRGADDYYNLGAGSIGAYTVYGYGAMCTENSSGLCTALYGTILGIQNVNGANNIPNAANIYFGYAGAGYIAIGKKTAGTAVDVNGTVTATAFTGSGTNLTNTNKVHFTGLHAPASWVYNAFDNIWGMTQYGQPNILAADMVAGKIMRFKAYGLIKNVGGHANQPMYFDFRVAGTQLMLLSGTYPVATAGVWSYEVELVLVWTSGTTFNATMAVTIEPVGTTQWNGMIGSLIGSYTVAHADSVPNMYIYSGNNYNYFQYSGIASTIETLY